MENQSSMAKYFILAALRRKEMHGYDLMNEIEKALGKKPSASQVYPVLKKMKAAGYVTFSVKTEGRKKMKLYSITKQGEQLFTAISARFDSIIAAALKERIKICAHCSCEILSGAYSRKISGKKLYFCCVSCANSFKP
jgi:DNA-binding PadR family transcriptional regulator